MNADWHLTPSPRPDRLLMTLEQLLAIDATEVKSALHQAAQLLSKALDVQKIDVFFHEPAINSLLALGTSDSPMSRRQKALALDRIQIANRGRCVEVFFNRKVIPEWTD